MPYGIYPEDLAKELKASAGEKYRPSNGTEGECFFSAWCCHCARDKSMREGTDVYECDDEELCEIIGATMRFNVEDENYPREWQYDKNGQPCCTAYIEAGESIPFIDTSTGDLFAGICPKCSTGHGPCYCPGSIYSEISA